MRTILAFILLAVLGVAGAHPDHGDNGDAGKVFMFIPEGSRDLELMLREEVNVMRRMLGDAGYGVDIATADGRPLRADGITVRPTVQLKNVNVEDYAGIIIPCMAPAPGSESTPDAVTAIVERAVELGKPVAASRGSVGTLAKAGALVGKEYAYASAVDTSKRPEFAGGNYLGIGVVRDGNISTAGICPLAARSLGEPDGTVELTENFIESLSDAD